ncbi:HAD hydrolase-like protein [Cytobacillus sp. Hm23]
MIKHVIFDFDGTLVKSRDLAVSLFNELSSKYGYRKMSKDDVEYMSTLSIKERCKMLGVSWYKLPLVVYDMKSNYNARINELIVVEGIKHLLMNLKERKYKMDIISSNNEENIRTFLIENNIDVFDNVFCTKSLFQKNITLKKLLQRLELKNSEVLYICDEIRDIPPCKELGVKSVAVTWGYDARQSLEMERPDFIINKPTELLTILDKEA